MLVGSGDNGVRGTMKVSVGILTGGNEGDLSMTSVVGSTTGGDVLVSKRTRPTGLVGGLTISSGIDTDT